IRTGDSFVPTRLTNSMSPYFFAWSRQITAPAFRPNFSPSTRDAEAGTTYVQVLQSWISSYEVYIPLIVILPLVSFATARSSEVPIDWSGVISFSAHWERANTAKNANRIFLKGIRFFLIVVVVF